MYGTSLDRSCVIKGLSFREFLPLVLPYTQKQDQECRDMFIFLLDAMWPSIQEQIQRLKMPISIDHLGCKLITPRFVFLQAKYEQEKFGTSHIMDTMETIGYTKSIDYLKQDDIFIEKLIECVSVPGYQMLRSSKVDIIREIHHPYVSFLFLFLEKPDLFKDFVEFTKVATDRSSEEENEDEETRERMREYDEEYFQYIEPFMTYLRKVAYFFLYISDTIPEALQYTSNPIGYNISCICQILADPFKTTALSYLNDNYMAIYEQARGVKATEEKSYSKFLELYDSYWPAGTDPKDEGTNIYGLPDYRKTAVCACASLDYYFMEHHDMTKEADPRFLEKSMHVVANALSQGKVATLLQEKIANKAD